MCTPCSPVEGDEKIGRAQCQLRIALKSGGGGDVQIAERRWEREDWGPRERETTRNCW